ncbi:hypothetical protein UFOVP1230_22 [uncultured Caudovirales phage]|uniref:Uncharacterized protein n=1 Tax=uncultured Caudovirales phage TaxID=2100421 RepID=A0A6J5RBG2_9CAUD|nr:hypothetical protein UFOVP1230_22 [uncultured Caudovirales phage]
MANKTRTQDAIESAMEVISEFIGGYKKLTDAEWRIIQLRMEIVATSAETDMLSEQYNKRCAEL